jgi:hypothetical protein
MVSSGFFPRPVRHCPCTFTQITPSVPFRKHSQVVTFLSASVVCASRSPCRRQPVVWRGWRMPSGLLAAASGLTWPTSALPSKAPGLARPHVASLAAAPGLAGPTCLQGSSRPAVEKCYAKKQASFYWLLIFYVIFNF